MSFGNAIKSFFSNYANFKGRARRSEFWYSLLFVFVVAFALNLVLPGQTMDFGGIPVQVPGPAYNLWALGTFIPFLSVTWRRLHDVNTSGAYYFIGLVPFVGAILLIVKLATEGISAPNAYGNPVK